MTPSRFALVTSMLASILLGTARADVAPAGTELQVNTYTTGGQSVPAVAADPTGRFVVVWRSGYYGAQQEGFQAGVFGQRYDATGVPAGSEFQVNTYTTGAQQAGTVSADALGNFVVAWQSGGYYGPGQDGSAMGVFVQRFDASGARLGSELQANTFTRGRQGRPAVASDPAGNFIVVWQSGGYLIPFGSITQDGSDIGVFGQRFAASGAPLGPEFQVNTYTIGAQVRPAVAADAAGDFVVVWQSYGTYPGQDGSGSGVFAQRFDSAGARLGTEFQVNTYTTGGQTSPSVTMDAAGAFVVVWDSSGYGYYGHGGQDGSGGGIFAQRFDSAGARLGPEFQVNTYTTGSQARPAVAAGMAGDFVVTWESFGSYSIGQDGSSGGVFAQHFASNGQRLGNELQVNTYTTGAQSNPRIAGGASGKFVVAWQSYAGQDGSYSGVFAQRFKATAVVPPTAVTGARLGLKANPDDATRKSLLVRSSDVTVTLGGGNGSSDDPTLNGGRLRVQSATFDDTYDLPAAKWHPIGQTGANRGYRYRDPLLLAGPVRSVLVKAGFLRATGVGAGLGHILATNPDPVTVVLQTGDTGQRYCMRFGGTTRFKPNTSFHGAGASASCSP